jgi:putative tricarboxylic transport membrane protein
MNNDQISSAFWFAAGLAIVFASLPYGIGGIRAPDTGFLPFLTGVCVCLLAVIVFIDGTRERLRGVKWKNPFANIMWAKPLVAMTALVVYVVILDPVGFILATMLLVGFLLRAIVPQSWRVVLIGATLTSLVTYVVFAVWLETQLPAGLLTFLN